MSTLNLKQSPELLLELETYLKSGRIGFGLLTLDRQDEAIINELMIQYRDDLPILYIKNPDGNVVPVATASDWILEEFLEKFMEVGKELKYPGYQPKLFFMTKGDPNVLGSGMKQEALAEFHKYIKQNKTILQPELTSVYKNGKENKLVPYVGTNFVWYDLGQVISGEQIRSLDDVLSIFYRITTDARELLSTEISHAKKQVQIYSDKSAEDNDRQDKILGKLQKDVATVEGRVGEITSKLGIINAENEKRMRPKTFAIEGDSDRVYPVKISYVGGGFSLDGSGGYEFFLGPMFVSFQNQKKHGVLQLGLLHSHNSPKHYSGSQESSFIYSHHIVGTGSQEHVLFDAKMIAPGTYIVMCKGRTTYTVWSKHSEYVVIDSSLQPKEGFNILSTTNKPNAVLCNDAHLDKDIVLHFHKSLHVTDSIVINNRLEIKLGE